MLMKILNTKKTSTEGTFLLEKAKEFCIEIEKIKHKTVDVEEILKKSKSIFHITYRNQEVIKLLRGSKETNRNMPVCLRLAECARGHFETDQSTVAGTSLFTNMMKRYEDATKASVNEMPRVILLEAYPMCVPIIGNDGKTIVKDPQNMWKMFTSEKNIGFGYVTLYMRFQIAMIRLSCRIATIQPIGTKG